MKTRKIIYALLLFSGLAHFVSAQKFVNLENRWRMTLFNRGQTYAYLTFFKDSIEIGGKYYYRPCDSIVNKIEIKDDYYREEAGIVYQFRHTGIPGASNEEVLYNFNMAVGDSIVYNNNFRLKVINIDSITLLNGTKRKRLELYARSRPYNFFWVEGIGAIDFETLRPNIASAPHVSDFSCYFHKNELLYSNPYHEGSNGGLSCSPKLADSVNTHNFQELNSLEILQNQGDGQVIFQLNESGRYQCHLYTATGAVLEQKMLGQGVHRISLLEFPKGMYFLRIMDTERWQQKTLKVLW